MKAKGDTQSVLKAASWQRLRFKRTLLLKKKKCPVFKTSLATCTCSWLSSRKPLPSANKESR